MKLTFLGTGSAFTVGEDNYHSNMLLENDKGERLLIDCGSDVRFSLNELGLTYRDIHDVYISHFHADHMGGLEWLGFTTKFDPNCKKPNLHCCERMLADLWNKGLSAGLSSLQVEHATLSSFFRVHPIKENSEFTWKELKIHIVQTVHAVSGFAIMPSYGLLFTVNGLTVFITTDTQFCPTQLRDFYDCADIVFQDCETSLTKSSVHAHYEELLTLPAALRKKMWLYHYNPGDLPDAAKDGFLGFVKKGQCFDFSHASTLE